MTEINKRENKNKMKKNSLRSLRISLKYRPDVLKLILKMRLCIHRKTVMVKKLKSELSKVKATIKALNKEAESNNVDTKRDKMKGKNKQPLIKHLITKTIIDSSTQTENVSDVKESLNGVNADSKSINAKGSGGWDIKNDGGEKSIAEQVTEVAENALQQTGMVYVESAGMYYDYKTGYYYNTELGLYYHTDTGCYYIYSDDTQSFLFHSYPDRSAENAALAAHEKKKAKKRKKELQKEVDIDNLTKHMSQEEEQLLRKPKRRKHSKKTVGKKPKKCVNNSKEDNAENPEAIKEQNADENTAGVAETSHDNVEETNEQETNEEGTSTQPLGIDLEDGECSETEGDTTSDEDCESNASTSSDTDDETIARNHAPCMRIIVKDTNLTRLKVGSLFLITKDGGTIGREGEQHSIIVNDYSVSRNHLDISYHIAMKMYLATDLGSKNGTLLNGIRMSESHVISNPMEIVHGSLIQVGDTKLLCHIHKGNDTCGLCEPGLIMEGQDKLRVAYTRTCNVQRQYQLELARLKNKYAKKPLMIDSVPYNDRAQARREKVGSSHPAEKTQTSDLNTYIPAENKGFKLLEKMGWSKGEGLGKDSQGGTEPVPLISNDGTAGLGSSSGITPQQLPMSRLTSNLGPATLRLAAKTKMLDKPAKAFQDQLDDDSD